MKIALIAPSGVPFVVGGAEKLWWGLAQHVNRHTPHEMELIKLPSPEHDFAAIAASYERWSLLDLRHFDAVISTKYPVWIVEHPNHTVYLQHKLRGLYDTYPAHLPTQLPTQPGRLPPAAQALWALLASPSTDRRQLPEIFGRVRELLASTAIDPQELASLTALPAPLVRGLVHKLDAIALQPGAIRKYLAISQLVAERADYFPVGARVEVLPHPSNLEGLHTGPSEFVFTASRLDGPKRIDMIINGYKRTQTPVPLWIAGDGPEAPRLKALAEGDARIRFLGRLTDEALVEHYSRAALVPFVPHLEDMGLITLEAMACGKPVLTVSDAGGVTEFVEDGVNGRIVPPNDKALGAAMDELLADPVKLQAMGVAASATAATVSWERTAQGLLAAAVQGQAAHQAEQTAAARRAESGLGHGMPGPRVRRADERLRLLVVNTFSVYPPDNGGKKRMFYLYRGLAQWADVTLLNIGPWGSPAQERVFGPHYREVCVPPSEAFGHAEKALTDALKRSVTDIAALLYGEKLTEYVAAFDSLAAQSDVVVSAHVYLAPLVLARWQGPVWYDAHNVEADMKAVVLEQPLPGAEDAQTPLAPLDLHASDVARRAVQQVAAREAQLVQRAERVFAVSAANRERFAALYGRPVDTMEVAANGTHLPTDAWLEAPRRAALKAQLGWGERPLAIFVASYHGPNLTAVDAVRALAAQCPDWGFAVVGSVCDHFRGQRLPANLVPMGVVSEGALTALLRAADVGLNPMASGSGTNLKMLDYAGHGLLVLSTPVGARGLALAAGTDFIESDTEGFATALQALAPRVPSPHPEVRAAARAVVERVYGWDSIAAALQPAPAAAQAAD
ncbi:MAG: glycosyltransferase [Burkholderiaceae bacterium]|nr:glycosyltransferase [Burkholderiaceae bacterium]